MTTTIVLGLSSGEVVAIVAGGGVLVALIAVVLSRFFVAPSIAHTQVFLAC